MTASCRDNSSRGRAASSRPLPWVLAVVALSWAACADSVTVSEMPAESVLPEPVAELSMEHIAHSSGELCFLDGRRYLAVEAGFAGTFVWELATGQVPEALPGLLVGQAPSGELVLWDRKRLVFFSPGDWSQPSRELEMGDEVLNSRVKLSQDGRLAAISRREGKWPGGSCSIELLDTSRAAPVRRLVENSSACDRHMFFSSDASLLASIRSPQNVLEVFEVKSGLPLRRFHQGLRFSDLWRGANLYAATFNQDNGRFAAWSWNGRFSLWRLKGRIEKEADFLLPFPGAHPRGRFSPDGTYFAAVASGNPGSFVLWDLAQGRPAAYFRGDFKSVAGLAFSGDGALLALERLRIPSAQAPAPDGPARTRRPEASSISVFAVEQLAATVEKAAARRDSE